MNVLVFLCHNRHRRLGREMVYTSARRGSAHSRSPCTMSAASGAVGRALSQVLQYARQRTCISMFQYSMSKSPHSHTFPTVPQNVAARLNTLVGVLHKSQFWVDWAVGDSFTGHDKRMTIKVVRGSSLTHTKICEDHTLDNLLVSIAMTSRTVPKPRQPRKNLSKYGSLEHVLLALHWADALQGFQMDQLVVPPGRHKEKHH